MKKIHKKAYGFTLIELIAFIIVIGIAATAVFISFNRIVTGSTRPDANQIAIDLAERRMELILGNRFIQGFVTFTDPCTGGSPPAVCNTPSGYNVSATITTDPDPDFKTIEVVTTGMADASVTMRVATY